MKFNPVKDFQSDQIQRGSRKILTAHDECRNADLNLTLDTGATNGFIFQIINSLIESWGCAWPALTVTTILNFSYEVLKSFVICKTVSKLAVIYASSLGSLWFGCSGLNEKNLLPFFPALPKELSHRVRRCPFSLSIKVTSFVLISANIFQIWWKGGRYEKYAREFKPIRNVEIFITSGTEPVTNTWQKQLVFVCTEHFLSC